MACRPWLGLALGVVLLATVCDTGGPAADAAAWPQYRGDLSRDGHPPGALLGPAEAARLRPAWAVRVGGSIDGSPAVADGLVVAGTEAGELAAYHVEDGRRAWAVPGLGPITGSPAIAGGRVLVGTLSGRVDAVDERSGRRLWSWPAPGVEPAIWSSPVVYRGRVIVGIASQYGDTPLAAGRLVALDQTGRPLWDDCIRPVCQTGGGIWSSLAIDGRGRGFVGVGNPDDAVLAVDAATGRRLWETSLHPDKGRDLDVGATPVVLEQGGQERVAVGSTGGDFALLDAGSGRPVWSRTIVNGSAVHGLIGSPAYDGTRLYVPSASPPDGVFALSTDDGHVLWRAATAEPVYSSPAVGAGVVAVGTGAAFGSTAAGRVQVLSAATGHLLWSYDAHAAVWSSPAIAGHDLCVGDHAGWLRCFRAPR